LIAALKLAADAGPNDKEHLKLSFDHKQFIPLYKHDEMSSDVWLKHVLKMYQFYTDVRYLK
jgi:hypothetical protein